jgi:hypothetical protein
MNKLTFFCFFISVSSYSQPWQSLRQYVHEHKIIDYGYGMWFDQETAKKKYFNFNSFLLDKLYFTIPDFEKDDTSNAMKLRLSGGELFISLDQALYFNDHDTVRVDTIASVTYLENTILRSKIFL